jgi:hypothetical protein
MNELEDVTRDQMLAEIAAMLAPPEPPEGTFTAMDMAKLWGIHNDAAANRLQRDPRVELVGQFSHRNYYRIKND